MDPGLRQIVLARLEADGSLGHAWSVFVLGALGGSAALEAQLAGSSAAPGTPESQTSPAPTGAFLRSVVVEGFRGIGRAQTLEVAPGPGLAADLLARGEVETVGVVGSGSQARYQLEALLGVRRPRRVLVHGRSADRAAAYAAEMSRRHGLDVRVTSSAREAVEASDVVITATLSREPLVCAEWLRPGTHVTAVGSDGPAKRELESAVLARADKVVADSLAQCLRLGEIHHAVAEGALRAEDVYAELGELAAGLKAGRTSDAEITVADLTGVGVQDAAVADFVTTAAIERQIGDALVL